VRGGMWNAVREAVRIGMANEVRNEMRNEMRNEVRNDVGNDVLSEDKAPSAIADLTPPFLVRAVPTFPNSEGGYVQPS
jgi:hypothetical protein